MPVTNEPRSEAEETRLRHERHAIVDRAMEDLGLCGCGEPDAVLVMLLECLLEMSIDHLSRGRPDVRTWAQSGYRPCCGTCREPRVSRMHQPERACEVCGDVWDGSEASEKEAWYRESKTPSTAGRTLGLYLLNEKGYLEHGGSVGGSWLTDKGKEFFANYRVVLGD